MASPEDIRARDELAEAMVKLCHGFRTATVGAALVDITASWLAHYKREDWPEVFGPFLETVLQVAALTQEQRKETAHGETEANRD